MVKHKVQLLHQEGYQVQIKTLQIQHGGLSGSDIGLTDYTNAQLNQLEAYQVQQKA